MNTRTNPLLDVVDELTRPKIEHHVQKDDAGKYIKTHTAEHPPLLIQLRDAVNPSSNTAAGSSSLKSTRNLIDSDALYRYGLMYAAIGDWCRIWNVPVTRDPITDLRQWYIAYTRGGDDPQWYIRELNRWANLIRNIIEPSVRFPLNVSCPVCKSRTFQTDDGEANLFPIIVEYRRPKDGETIRPKALCRNTECGAVWEGLEAIQELGEEIQELETKEVPA